MRILVVEDEQDLNRILAKTLTAEGYSVDACFDGVEALDYLEGAEYDAIVLDVMMPRMDGFSLLAQMRESGNETPVIFLTAKDSVPDRVRGLDAGADDYLTKPFSVDELLARLRVTQRRIALMQSIGNEQAIYQNGDLKIDYSAGCAWVGEEELRMTPMEYKLLCLLARNTGRVLTHKFILQNVWGSSWENDVGTLRVFMATLRKKLETASGSPQYIQTHIGVGYRMQKVE